MEHVVMKLLPRQLKEGMILTKDIYLDNVVLLSAGVELNQKLIKKLIRLIPFTEVTISRKIDKDSIEDLGNIDEKKLRYINLSQRRKLEAQKIEKKFDELNNDVKKIFKNISLDKKVEIDDIRKLSVEVIENFNKDDYDIIVKNLLYENKVDDYVYRHSINVGVLSSMLGQWCGLKDKELLLLTYSAMLHDIGKTMVSSTILNKPGKLTQKEFEHVKKHSEFGYKIVKEIPFLDQGVSYGVLMHHEKLDGSGYPFGLKENKIHPFAKIIAVADFFDAITSKTCYRDKKSFFTGLEEMQSGAWGALDPKLCSLFTNHVVNLYTGEFVKLSNGKMGKIVKLDTFNISKPLIKVGDEFIDLKQRSDIKLIDLI